MIGAHRVYQYQQYVSHPLTSATHYRPAAKPSATEKRTHARLRDRFHAY